MYENEEGHTWVDWMRLASVTLMACFSPPPEDFPAILHAQAERLKAEREEINAAMSTLEADIDTVFKQYRDHGYRLHAIFVHRGGTGSGHYLIYIKDFQNGTWREYCTRFNLSYDHVQETAHGYRTVENLRRFISREALHEEDIPQEVVKFETRIAELAKERGRI